MFWCDFHLGCCRCILCRGRKDFASFRKKCLHRLGRYFYIYWKYSSQIPIEKVVSKCLDIIWLQPHLHYGNYTTGVEKIFCHKFIIFNLNNTVKISLTPFVSVLAYLALYRIDELGIAHFRKFVLSHEANKMHRVSGFSNCCLSNTENIICIFFFCLIYYNVK